MPKPAPDRLDTTIDALADTIRSIRDEAAALTELLGRLVEVVAAMRDRLDAIERENDELRAQLANRTNDTTTTTETRIEVVR